MSDEPTPAQAGYAMPPEWAHHAACLMSWPTREDLWAGRLDEAKAEYAAVARAIAVFEPLVMVCLPGSAQEVLDRCGGGVETLEFPIDDSWIRDNGPIFVRDHGGEVAVVGFGFNAWGERWHPYADDAKLPERIAAHLGLRFWAAPFVLEGGSLLVDGEGVLVTTEQCLLNPNRNPELSRVQIERGLRDFLGVSSIVWLPHGHSLDVGPAGTDGHVDGVAQLVGPRHILLEVPSDPSSPEYKRSRRNLAVLKSFRDGDGRGFTVSSLDPPTGAGISYANHYIANGGVVVPTVGDDRDTGMLEAIAKAFPGREVVGVPGRTLAYGGGGPHCITQQVPEGGPATA